MNMTINQKISLSGGLILIVLAAIVFGLIRPLFFELKQTSILVGAQKEKLFGLAKIEEKYLKELEQDYNKIKSDVFLLKKGFVDEKKAVEFFIELENIALQTSNKLEIKTEKFPEFTLSLTGEFSNLMKFIGWLENGKYFVDLNSIQIKRISNKDLSFSEAGNISMGEIKTTLKIKAYSSNNNKNVVEN